MTKKTTTGLVTLLMVVLVCSIAWACLKWSSVFNDMYKPKSDSAISKAGCAVCHVESNSKYKLNPYGKMLEGKAIEAKSLKAIEKKDSDKDGASNIKEIKAGTLPGDPKSKPRSK